MATVHMQTSSSYTAPHSFFSSTTFAVSRWAHRGIPGSSPSFQGPFSYVDGFEYGSVGGNPAPIYHDGAFYLTTQHTKAVWTTPSLAPGSKWSLFANVSFSNVPAGARPE